MHAWLPTNAVVAVAMHGGCLCLSAHGTVVNSCSLPGLSSLNVDTFFRSHNLQIPGDCMRVSPTKKNRQMHRVIHVCVLVLAASCPHTYISYHWAIAIARRAGRPVMNTIRIGRDDDRTEWQTVVRASGDPKFLNETRPRRVLDRGVTWVFDTSP
jgi:hypothetical protein